MIEPRNPVVWFEIPALDLERAKAFYEHVLDVELTLQEMGLLKMAWFPMSAGGPGATGCLVTGDTYEPSHAGTMVYLAVQDLEGALARVEEMGGKIISPRTSIGPFGFVAHFQDSEGNRVAFHSGS